jgi:hypothetical protein
MRKLILLTAALIVAGILAAPRPSGAWVSTGLGIGYAGPYPYPYPYAYPAVPYAPPVYYPAPTYYPSYDYAPGAYWPSYGPDIAVRWNSYFAPKDYQPQIRGYTLPR